MSNWMYSDFEDCGNYFANTKKVRHIYQYVYDMENILHSVASSQKRKARNRAVIKFNSDFSENVNKLYWMLKNKTYKPSKYKQRKIFEPKERTLSIAPYNPDRIIDHCLINVLDPIWMKIFVDRSYSCIKGRGIHACMEAVHKELMNDKYGTQYCLKIDIKKFYDNIEHAKLKEIVRYKIADEDMLWLIDAIIDSNGSDKGLPIGRFTSQYFANLYLTYFDHYCLEVLKCAYYHRYMDDIVVLSDNKSFLHQVLDKMAIYLGAELKLEIKGNWQIFPVDKRDIDYVGYRQNHYDVRIRKTILMRFYRKYEKTKLHYSLTEERDIKHAYSSEYGWLLACSDKHREFIIKNCLRNGKNH